MELNEHLSEFEDQGIEVYGISPSTPEEHEQLIAEEGLNLELLTDNQQLQFGIQHGFIDLEEEVVHRGYVGVNPESEHINIEVDYLVGDNVENVKETMEAL